MTSGRPESDGSPVVIIFKQAGPILVQGPAEFRDHNGNSVEPPPAKTPGTVKLCSCGRSGTRPFCDGTHKQPAA